MKDAFGVQTKFAWITDLQSWGWWAFYCLRQLIVFVRGRSFYLFSKSKPYLSVEKVNLWNQLGLYRSHSGGCAWASSTIVRPVRNQKYTRQIYSRNTLTHLRNTRGVCVWASKRIVRPVQNHQWLRHDQTSFKRKLTFVIISILWIEKVARSFIWISLNPSERASWTHEFLASGEGP